MIKRGIFVLALILMFCRIGSAALGISPAIVELDFVPGGEQEITYFIISDQPDKEIEIYANGDLAKYVTLSKESNIGAGTFTLNIKFPDEIEIPGEHRIGVGVREKAPEESFLGTRIDISGHIAVYAPYPGKYVEAGLNVPDGNVDDQIPIETHVINRGKESLDINVNVGFFSEDRKMVFYMPFKPVFLESGQDRYFRKFLDTAGFRAGNYLAEAVINYGEEVRVNKTFRIGSLFVNVTNFTNEMRQGGIQKFHVGIESKWNGDLNEVFADVNISNSTWDIGFRTPSVELKPWEEGILEGFLDTTGLEGKYNSNIELHYSGEKSYTSGELIVKEAGLEINYIIIGMTAIIIMAVIIFAVWIIRRNAFKKAWRKK